MLAQILQGDPRTVRGAVEVDLVVSEFPPDLIQIGNDVRRRVLSKVGLLFQVGAALFQRFEGEEVKGLAVLRMQLALQSIGPARAANVYEDDIKVVSDLSEQPGVEICELRGRLPGATLQSEECIGGCRALTLGLQHDDVERYTTTGGGAPVLGYLDRAAADIAIDVLDLARNETGGSLWLLSPR
jgi:hypothetical protein